MEIGKVPNDVLERIVFSNIKNKRKEVLVSASIGEDNGIIDFGENVCIVSTDPITGTTKDIGSLAIHISCNDVSTSGAEPVAVLLTILCPPETTEEDLEKIMKDAGEAATEINVEIIGGHTEVTDAVNKVLISTTVIGIQPKDKMLIRDVVAGDKIIITKFACIEGTSIIAKELEDELIDILGEDKIQVAKDLDKMLSVVKEGVLAGKYHTKYMHDITEGGVYGAVWEASKAVKKGLKIYKESIPFMDVTLEIAKILDIDPYRLISSGSMLMVMAEDEYKKLKIELDDMNIKSTIVGELIDDEEIYIVDDGQLLELDAPGSDELYKIFRKDK